jgi:pyrroline-5-carboxylate reductase
MTEQYLKSVKIGFIGGGNIASAIGAGLIRKGIFLSTNSNKILSFKYNNIYFHIDILNPTNIWVSGRTNRRHSFWNNLGVHHTLKNDEVMSNCDIIFLTVKPYTLDDVLSSIIEHQTEKFKNKLFISVLAGISLNILHNVSKL